jgi:NAD(P)-dependent dehydrogenase (short-subunit alcohol dehydrogenase family)
VAKHISELFNLEGKTAIVTGGSRGIGVEMAEALGEAGANLMLCARREEWLVETVEAFREKGFHVHGKTCDVAKPDEVQAVVDETVEKFGAVDILVNNAGVSWGAMPEDMPLEKWQFVLDVNLTGCFLFAQAVGREMLKREKGSIINIASIAGQRSSANGPFYAGYVASKAGLIGLTRELAASWGRKGIRVNAVAPGFFHSRLADKVIDIYERSIQETNPLPRIGAEGELKGVTVFLASDASSYITGQTIAVDGGMTV